MSAESGAHGLERRRIGALEAVDRLLGVADGEHGAHLLARAETGEEFLGQGGDDLPLLRVGVLGLIDQDVVEAAIELEKHPWRLVGLAQQIPRH